MPRTEKEDNNVYSQGIAVSWKEASPQIASLLNRNNVLTVYYKRLGTKDSEVVVYETLFGKVVASCTVEFPLFPNKNAAKIKHLVVSEDYQGKGLGKKILEQALTFCSESVIIFAMVRQSNLASIKTLDSVRFAPVMEVKGASETLTVMVRCNKEQSNG